MMHTQFAIVAACLIASVAESQEPRHVPQLVIPCEIIDVYDGDTVTVRVTVDVRVRLLDCWSPEVKGKGVGPIQKSYGIHSRETLKEIVDGEECLLIVDLDRVDRLDKLFTFGRLLSRIRTYGSGIDLAEEMVRMGAATETKSVYWKSLDEVKP